LIPESSREKYDIGRERILILTTSFPRFSGDPAGAFVKDTALQLATRGFRIQIVCPDGRNPSGYAPENVLVDRFIYFLPRRLHRVAFGGGVRFNILHDPLALIQLPFFLMSFLWRSAVHSKKNSLIHANWLIPSGVVGLIIKGITGRRLIVTARGSDVNIAFSNRFAFLLAFPVARKADAVVCVSRDLKKKVLSWGVPPDKVESFPDGVEDLPAGERRNITAICFIGRLVPEKRVQDLIEAIGLVPLEGLEVTIAGEGPMMKQLIKAAKDVGNAKIKFLGTVPRGRVPKMVCSHAMLVLPSSSEGLPDAILTGMATATPVVATRLPGVVQAVDHGVTGLLVPVGSPTYLARAIHTLCERPAYARRLGLRARRSVRVRFARERMISKLVDVYTRAIARDRSKPDGQALFCLAERSRVQKMNGCLTNTKNQSMT